MKIELPWKRRASIRPGFNGGSGYEPKPSSSVSGTLPSSPYATRPEHGDAVSASSVSDMACPLAVGSHIEHNRFGHGEVMDITGVGDATKATVRFDNLGEKQLLLKFAKYTIIKQ